MYFCGLNFIMQVDLRARSVAHSATILFVCIIAVDATLL
jgi:hypothetical protein